jgi:hypothetical protein
MIFLIFVLRIVSIFYEFCQKLKIPKMIIRIFTQKILSLRDK